MTIRAAGSVRRAGLGAGGLKSIYGFTLLAAGRALSLVIMAEAVAGGIASVVARTDAWHTNLAWGIAGALLRGAIAWGTRTFAVRSSLHTKEQLRRELAERLLQDGGAQSGSLSMLATHGLDELDNYYRTVLPAITGAAVIPMMIGARLLFADWVSAAIIAVTICLVPLFMALIGMHTSEKVAEASSALGRLSDHLVELARGLPVLVGLGRAEQQAEALKAISDEYRAKTMKTLRVAFMSSLALELISTISVAVVAVSIGFRLVSGDLTLGVALLVLILAPECFAPFRDLGASFHASQDGLGALRRVRAILDAPRISSLFERAPRVSVERLAVRYADRSGHALDPITFMLPHRGITAIQGVSGAGKSTLLGVLAGQFTNGADVSLSGRVRGIDPARLAWLPQSEHFVADTVRDELRTYGDDASGDGASTDAAAGGLDVRILRLLDRLDLGAVADDDPQQLSPGERRRVAFARVCLRVEAGATVVLLDEPTAHLDDAHALTLREMIAELGERCTVVLVSHDASVLALADNVIPVGAPSGLRQQSDVAPLSVSKPASIAPAPAGPLVRNDAPLATLVAFLRPAAKRYVAAAALGTAAVLFAMSLTTVSGWLIVKASEHPSIMYLGVAIVGVRFFGIGRSALHYAERLVTHDAVFESVGWLRLRTWRAFIARGATSRKLLGGGSALDNLVGTADHVRDLAPRVLIPAAVGVLSSAAVVVTVALLHAAALPLILACIVGCLVIAPAVTVVADRSAGTARQALQSEVLRGFAAMLGASGELRANGVGESVVARLSARDRAAGNAARHSSWALGLGSAIIVATCSATAVLTFAISAPAVASGSIPIELVAVLAFIPLALVDPLLATVEAVQRWPSLLFALGRIAPLLDADQTPAAHGSRRIASVHDLELLHLGAQWPSATEPVFSAVNALAARGQWMVVTGPSGSGKSTLLTVLLGYLAPSEGIYAVDGIDTTGVDTDALRRRVSWAPQEGHLFDSTLRANLLLARPAADAPSEEEMRETLAGVGLSSLLASLSDGLDTRVGAGGSHLSGGERQRIVVARSLLTRADVVLLDEPTAHLDAQGAEELVSDLRRALADKIVVLVTHHREELRDTDVHVRLESLVAPQAGRDQRIAA